MGLSGTHNYGNYFRKAVELDGDTVITGGNYTLCHVTTNGHSLDIQGGNVRGLYIDEVKQDDYVWQLWEPLPKAVEILEMLTRRGGEDGIAAWTIAVDVIHAGAVDLAFQDYKMAYAAEAGDNLTYSEALINALVPLLPVGWGWDEARDWINSKTRDQLTGEPTELVEEYS